MEDEWKLDRLGSQFHDLAAVPQVPKSWESDRQSSFLVGREKQRESALRTIFASQATGAPRFWDGGGLVVWLKAEKQLANWNLDLG
jgi:hypothetical protein